MTINRYTYKCDCIDPILDKIIEKNFDIENIEGIYLEPSSFSGDTASTITVEIKGEKRNKKKNYQLVHTYCPFCGKKLSEGESK